MSIDRLRAHWGLSRTPFTKELAPSMLFASAAHQEAVARIGWIITERALGVVCGEVGAGKTVAARAASAALDASRHTIIYLPNPAVGARDLHPDRLRARLNSTVLPGDADPAGDRPARRRNQRARQDRRAHLGRGSFVVGRAARGAADADELRDGLPRDVRVPAAGAADAAPQAQTGRVRRARSTDRAALHDRRDGPQRNPANTSSTTSSSPAAATSCSPMMRSR